MPDFKQSVLKACGKIPRGKVSTYKAIAAYLKKPNSARAVGNALNKNMRLGEVPCHRVVKSTGEPGGYALGSPKKIKLLKAEGIKIKKGRLVDFSNNLYFFKPENR